MSEGELKEWAWMWGAKVKLRNDMPDDMLKDAIETARRVIQAEPDFETQGLQCAETIKTEFDSRWSPHWHCVIGRNFGSFVTHETKNFIFFYLGDKAVMLFKSDVELTDKSNRSILDLEIPRDADPGLVHNNGLTGKFKFEFDKIFDVSTTQEAVFNVVAKSKVLDALDGINCTIFAYGQTGSGKSYTIFGGENYAERGLIPRSIGLVFAEIRSRQLKQISFAFKCQISFTEVYKENVYDLLDQENRNQSMDNWSTVQVMEGENGIIIRNLNVFEVNSEEEALQLFFMGNTNRITESTSMNSVSSRSHAIFTLILESEGIKDGKTIFSCGKINMVDLAGSERMYKMTNTNHLVKEAKSINLSLHYLEQVIISLREQAATIHAQQLANGSNNGSADVTTSKFIPYRNSILTSMLRDSLGGNCRSCFLINVSARRMHFEETVASCRFGQRCGEIKVKIVANTEIGLNDQLRELTIRVRALERQLQNSEDSRSQLEAILAEERQSRKLQTEMRVLTVPEKLTCKNCVQQLLSTAKDSVVMVTQQSANNNNVMNSTEASAAALESSIIEHSQEMFFRAVEGMDKAVLIELSTALGGLVQSMYIEREILKQETATKDRIRRQTENDIAEQQQIEALQTRILQTGDVKELSNLTQLPDAKLAFIRKGAVFVKHGWLGKKSVRYVSVSHDLLSICLIPVGKADGKSKNEENNSVPLSNFENVDFNNSPELRSNSNKAQQHDNCTMILRGRNGGKSLTLEYADRLTYEENFMCALEWVEVLRYLLIRAQK